MPDSPPVQAAPQPRPPASAPSTTPPPLVPVPLGEAWGQMVNQLVAAEAVAALTRELGLQSELRSQDGSLWTLRVERESLNQGASRERLQNALAAAGHAVRLAIEIGSVGDSPARRNRAANEQRQKAAEEAIQADPDVQYLMQKWGARIVPGSLRPA